MDGWVDGWTWTWERMVVEGERESRVSQMTRIGYETALFQIGRYFKGPTVESSLITKSEFRLFFTMNSLNHVFELLAMVHVPN